MSNPIDPKSVAQWGLPAKLTMHTLDDNPAMEALRRAGRERVRREEIITSAAAQALRAASECVGELICQIEKFENSLDEHQEVAVFVIGGPAGASFFPTSIQAIDPDKVVFDGIDPDGGPFVVVQHVTQLNFALRAVRTAPDEPPRRIGFHHPIDED